MKYSINEAMRHFSGKEIKSTVYQDKNGFPITRTAEEWIKFFKNSDAIHLMFFTIVGHGIRKLNDNDSLGAELFQVTKT